MSFEEIALHVKQTETIWLLPKRRRAVGLAYDQMAATFGIQFVRQ